MGIRNGDESYKKFDGCVLDMYERNYADDSDFYAVVWDEESNSVIDVEYDTTRFAGYGSCEIDATEDSIRKAYRFFKSQVTDKFDKYLNPFQAREVKKNDVVTVVRGRKIPQGTVGKVFWLGEVYNQYTRSKESRVGIQCGENKVFLPTAYVSVNGWEDRLMHGKVRKAKIRSLTLGEMPRWIAEMMRG